MGVHTVRAIIYGPINRGLLIWGLIIYGLYIYFREARKIWNNYLIFRKVNADHLWSYLYVLTVSYWSTSSAN
jgi:hypothetical protein